LLDRITRQWLETIGLRAGMRILDVGSGVGDTAMLLASLVGPTAEIIGVDLDGSALAIARQRVAP
jgi:ubiquinone/menaquinone biosynthesis C-methylase UbiE